MIEIDCLLCGEAVKIMDKPDKNLLIHDFKLECKNGHKFYLDIIYLQKGLDF